LRASGARCWLLVACCLSLSFWAACTAAQATSNQQPATSTTASSRNRTPRTRARPT
jgi:hypothetical protein